MPPNSSSFTNEVPDIRPRITRILESRLFSAIGSAFKMGSVGLLLVSWIIALIPLYAWCCSVLWGWFMVPILKLPPITVWQAVAIALVLRCFTFEYDLRVPSQRETATGRGLFFKLAIATTIPFFMLLLGAILRAIVI